MIEFKILHEMEPVPSTAEVVKMVRDLESLTQQLESIRNTPAPCFRLLMAHRITFKVQKLALSQRPFLYLRPTVLRVSHNLLRNSGGLCAL